jgi:hypothetical protein
MHKKKRHKKKWRLGWGFFFCSLGFMGVSSGYWVFEAFGYCVCGGSGGFSFVG